MSYEYKALIEQAIIDDDRPLDWEEGFKELDEVYAKAQAYDDIMELIEKHSHYTEDFHVDWELVGEELIDLELDDL